MKNLLIINAYPNNDYKISLLYKQLSNFKQLGVKILVVSGCDVPERLRSYIDYLIVNTDNIRIDKDHTYKCINELGMNDTAYWFARFDNCSYGVYGSHVNVTICKNIKIAFKMAQMLGYKNIFYTEDDNIFKPESFDLIHELFYQLDTNQYKLMGVLGNLADDKCVYTTFFAANVDFLLEKFTIPDTKEGYYNDDNIVKYKLNKPLEISFYHILKDSLGEIKNIQAELDEMVSQNKAEFNQSKRADNINWVYDGFVQLLPDKNKNKHLIVHNTIAYISDTSKETFQVEIYFDDKFITTQTLAPCVAFFCKIDDDIKKIKVKLLNKFEREIDTDYELIKYNGIFFSDYL